MSPFQSGLVTFSSAVGAIGMKTVAARIIRTFGFRNMMTVNGVVSSVFLAACALFTLRTPLLIIFLILVVGGFFRSLHFTSINTIAYAEVEPAQMSRATTLVSVKQQVAISAGVAVGAFSVESTMLVRHASELNAGDFLPRSWSFRSSRRYRPISSGRCPTMPGTRFRAARPSKFPAAKARKKPPSRRPAKDPGRKGSTVGMTLRFRRCEKRSDKAIQLCCDNARAASARRLPSIIRSRSARRHDWTEANAAGHPAASRSPCRRAVRAKTSRRSACAAPGRSRQFRGCFRP